MPISSIGYITTLPITLYVLTLCYLLFLYATYP